MKPRLTRPVHTLAVHAAALACVAAAPGAAQEPSMDVARVQELMMQANVPGEAHARLASLEGTWEQTVRIRPAHGAPVMEMRGRATNRMILGGRFLETRFQAGEGQLATEGLTLVGVDLRSQEYTLAGFDTWGTFFVTGQGPYDPGTGSAVMSGTDEDPLLKHTQVYDFVLEWVDADTYVMRTVFHDDAHTGGQGPLTMVETIHRRVAR